MKLYFHHSSYFLDPNKCNRNYVEAGTKWPKRHKLNSRAKNGRTWENKNLLLNGFLKIIFGWQISKGVISWPVKGFTRILDFSHLLFAPNCHKLGIQILNDGDDNQKCHILMFLLNWIKQLHILGYNLNSSTLFYTNISISKTLTGRDQ